MGALLLLKHTAKHSDCFGVCVILNSPSWQHQIHRIDKNVNLGVVSSSVMGFYLMNGKISFFPAFFLSKIPLGLKLGKLGVLQLQNIALAFLHMY